jgi:hypothetical protein
MSEQTMTASGVSAARKCSYNSSLASRRQIFSGSAVCVGPSGLKILNAESDNNSPKAARISSIVSANAALSMMRISCGPLFLTIASAMDKE